MSVRKKEEILETIKSILGDRTDDEAIAIVEDVSDTLADYEARGDEDWKKKYEENDAAWRRRYRDRFYSGKDDEEEIDENEEVVVEKKTYDDLFERKE